MDLPLHPQSLVCVVTGRSFEPGERVTSFLARNEANEVVRYDVLSAEEPAFKQPSVVFCRWTRPFKARTINENSERTLKLTAENLFLTLADPATEPNPANTPLLQFLALLLERKKLLRPRGMTNDGIRNVFEHAKTHQLYEIPAGDLNEEFFMNIQSQLDVLVGPPKVKVGAATPGSEIAISPEQ